MLSAKNGILVEEDSYHSKSDNGVKLVPQPSSDPADPLNWPQARKNTTLAILSLAAFAGTASSLANQLGFEAQSKVYHKSLVELSYSISSAVAGIAFGPLLAVPLAHVFGRSAVIWWSLLGALGCGVWSARMTGASNYNAFVVARLFGGIFGSVPSILGTGMIIDIFYLHERGRALTTFHVSFMLGTVAGPTFGGFIVDHVSWTIEFWWTVALQGLIFILAFFFLEQTAFARDGNSSEVPRLPDGFLASRVALLLPGIQSVAPISGSNLARYAYAPIAIGLSPVGILTGAFGLASFGWFVTINTLLTIFLQEPKKKGGYAFTPQRNAAFTFALWFGVFAAQIWGYLLNDSVPLWLCRRRGGTWKPEFRLHSLWIPSLFIMPIGLGIFGAALQHHLHYMVLALGSFLVTFAAMVSVPVAVNYLAECFRGHTVEVSAILGVYRLSLGLAVPFFIEPWIQRVGGPGWVFGMAAFFSMFAFSLLVVLMWKGHRLRQVRLGAFGWDEEGTRLMEKNGGRP